MLVSEEEEIRIRRKRRNVDKEEKKQEAMESNYITIFSSQFLQYLHHLHVIR